MCEYSSCALWAGERLFSVAKYALMRRQRQGAEGFGRAITEKKQTLARREPKRGFAE
jgi:hypothetical protein